MMTLLRTTGLIVALACGGLASGCASQPIALGVENQSDLAAQTRLRYTSTALTTQIDQVGWSISASPEDARAAFLGRLIHGAQHRDTADDPVQVYLASHGDAAEEQLLVHIQTVIDQVEILSVAAQDVAMADTPVSAPALSIDIASAESALGAARRAHRFFAGVVDGLEDQGVYAHADVAELLIDQLGDAEERLADATDALAERRWAIQSQQGLSS